MLDVLRLDKRRTAVIFIAVTLVAVVYLELILAQALQQNGGQFGVPTDDTWIRVRFATHIAEGQGLSFNDGTLSTGATSPLWVLLLAPIYAAFNPTNTGRVAIAAGLSCLGFILTVWSITGLSWWQSQRAWVALMVGLLTALTGRLVWFALSGLETTTFIALTILAIWSHLDDLRAVRPAGWRTGIFLGLATLARPEGYLLTAIVTFDIMITAIQRDKWFWSGIGDLIASWRAGVTYWVLAGTYMLLYLLISGNPFPTMVRVSTETGWQFPNLLNGLLIPREDFGPIMIVLILAGMLLLLWSSWRKQISGWALALWPTLLVLSALFAGLDRVDLDALNRYVVAAVPYEILALVVALVALWEYIAKQPNPVVKYLIQFVAMIAIPFTIFVQGYNLAARLPADIQEIQHVQVKAAEYIQQSTQPGQLVALNNIGTIAQISNRPVLDLVGMVSPEVIPAQTGSQPLTCPYDLQLARIMLRESPVLIGVSPDRYPCLTSWPGALQSLRTFPDSESGSDSMVIGAPVWDKWPMLRDVPTGTVPVNTVFSQGIELAAYEAEVVDSGLQVTLWWRVHSKPAADYHIFLHLLDSSDNLLGQHDGQPQADHFPTSWWQAGDVIRDEHLIPVDNTVDFSAQNFFIEIELYKKDNGQRLLVENVAPGAPADSIKIPLKIETSTALLTK